MSLILLSCAAMAREPRRRGRRDSLWIVLLATALMFSGCTDRATRPGDQGPVGSLYSGTVGPIFDRHCNTAGCHGDVRPGDGLRLTSWDRVIAGSDFGEVIIPFRPDHSHLLDHLTGITTPRMPLSRDPLPAQDIEIIRQWIADGAANDAGELPYEHSRRKIYVTNEASDLVSVIDADALVVMRLIDVGVDLTVDAPHNIHVDRQGRYWYVSLINRARLLQFDAATDSLRHDVRAGTSPANPFASPDGSTVYVTNWDPSQPTLHAFDAETMVEEFVLRFPEAAGGRPHGICVTADGSIVYTTHEGGDHIFKIELGETVQEISMTPIPLHEPGEHGHLEPYQVVLDAAERFAYVSCEEGEVRVVDTLEERLVGTIELGGELWLEALSPDGRQLYVANWGNNTVDIIDTATRTHVATIGNDGRDEPVFANPHGVAFSPDGRHAFVTSANRNDALPQHHPSESGGENGNVAVIDVATREVVKILELDEWPTGVAFSVR